MEYKIRIRRGVGENDENVVRNKLRKEKKV